MKYIRFFSSSRFFLLCICAVVSLSLFVGSSIDVFALDSVDLPILDYVENQEVYVGSWEFMDTPRFNETYILESPSVYASSEIPFSSGTQITYFGGNHNYGVGYEDGLRGDYSIGNLVSLSRCLLYIDFFNTNLLFTEGGQIKLRIYSSCQTINQGGLDMPWHIVNVYRITTDSVEFIEYNSNQTSEVVIDNSNNDIYRIRVNSYHGNNNVQQVLGVSGFDYITTTEEEENASKNIFELLKTFIGGFWDNILSKVTDAVQPILDNIRGLAYNFNNFVSNFVANIQNAILGLFIPPEGTFDEFISNVRTLFESNLGFVWEITEWSISFLVHLRDAVVGDCIITFPGIKFLEYELYPQTDIDLQEILDEFSVLQTACRTATSFMFILATFTLARNKLKEWLA